MEPLLSLQDITKSFGKRIILDDLSLNLYPGEIVGLIGRSGCGKSTLIKILVGHYKPDSGKIILDGSDITRKPGRVKKFVGYTTQENSFYDKLTIYENMMYYASLYDVPKRKQRIAELLEAVYLAKSRKILACDISGGMKRRLDFAISLLHRPKLVILDEPTTGLDPLLVEQFWNVVTRIAMEEKITVLVSSHILSEIEGHCTRTAVMSNGGIRILESSGGLHKRFRELTA